MRHVFKDSATAFNGQKKATIKGKGEINAHLTSLLMTYLNESGTPTHFIEQDAAGQIITDHLQMFPLEVVVRNKVAGSLAKRLQVKEGDPILPPLVEWFLKDDPKNDPQVSLGILEGIFGYSKKDLTEIEALALEVNKKLKSLFLKANLDLVDFKLEMGRNQKGVIVVGDEITPDTCRLWDSKTQEKLDKDRFRFELGDLMEGYREIEKRLKGVLSQ